MPLSAEIAPTIMTGAAPTVPFNDGFQIPRLGLGVWQIENDKVGEIVAAAIGAGYRLIDTAQGYDNEAGVGRALSSLGIQRQDLFVTTKLRTKAMGASEALEGVKASLQSLRLDYLDMMLIHWPTPARDTYAATWQSLVQAQADGLVRSIGVSNFLPEHVERIIGETGVFPAVNQIELHPYFQQRQVRDFHERHGIRIQSYSPLGHGEVLEDSVIAGIASRLGKSPAQVILRWHLQENLLVIPKSGSPERITENIDVFDFQLSEHDMIAIADLDRGEAGRTSSNPATFNDLY